jgi:hypothetical protein
MLCIGPSNSQDPVVSRNVGFQNRPGRCREEKCPCHCQQFEPQASDPQQSSVLTELSWLLSTASATSIENPFISVSS